MGGLLKMFKKEKKEKVRRLRYCVIIKIDTGWNTERKFVILKAENEKDAKDRALESIGWSDSKKSWVEKGVEKVYCERL